MTQRKARKPFNCKQGWNLSLCLLLILIFNDAAESELFFFVWKCFEKHAWIDYLCYVGGVDDIENGTLVDGLSLY